MLVAIVSSQLHSSAPSAGQRWRRLPFAAACIGFGASPSLAAPAWTLDQASSTLTYQSVKKNTIVETNKIRNITGTIASDGAATVTFDLNSVDTGVDIRNVRMRFLFFETFKYPAAILSAKLNPAAFADLPAKRRMTLMLPYRLSLHGVEKDFESEVVVTMITAGTVSVASKSPIAINVADFGLLPGIEKLQEAAAVSNILPVASVSFDFVFAAEGRSLAPAVAASGDAGPVATDETKAAYSEEECLNRFAVLSRTGAIYFAIGSAALDPASRPLLDAVFDVAGKCPRLKVEVAGDTDADGPEDANRRLSRRRANAVVAFLLAAGIPEARIAAAGYGETQPIASNDTDKNKALNRRIEFSASPLAE